jgi:hypothetical protein
MLEATPFNGQSRSFTTQRGPRRHPECRACGSSLHGRLERRGFASVNGIRLAYLRGIGTPIPEMCRRLGFGVSVYYRWVNEAEQFAVLDRMREAGLSFDEIEAIVAALERSGSPAGDPRSTSTAPRP